MRHLSLPVALTVALAPAFSAHAQSTLPASPQPNISSSAPAVGSWDTIKNLTTLSRIRVSDPGHHDSCIFISADDNNLVCENRSTIFFFPIHTRTTFRRAEVTKVRMSHRFYSSLAGGAIGFGIGAAIGAGIDSHYSQSVIGAHAALVYIGITGAIFGSQIGHFTDFLASPTVYSAH